MIITHIVEDRCIYFFKYILIMCGDFAYTFFHVLVSGSLCNWDAVEVPEVIGTLET